MALRLTLRTLLAYLDDTLDPTQAREIGEKLSESEAAQKLVERMKAVVRKRRLLTPTFEGKGSVDVNFVAEYLDNELDSDKIAAFEKECLESDTLLAEVASTHQILTMVLGEPVAVPPAFRLRLHEMLSELKGRSPVRKDDRSSLPEPVLLGSSTFLGDDSPIAERKWSTTLVAIVLLIALGVSVGRTLTPRKGAPPEVASSAASRDPMEAPAPAIDEKPPAKSAEPTPPETALPAAIEKPAPEEATKPEPAPEKVEPAPAETEKPAPAPEPEKPLTPEKSSEPETAPKPSAPEPAPEPPSVAPAPTPVALEDVPVEPVAHYASKGVLLARTAGGLKRLAPDEDVVGRETILNVDGYRAVLAHASHSSLELMGSTVATMGASSPESLQILLEQGRLAVRGGDAPFTLIVGLGADPLRVRLEGESSLAGVEREYDAPYSIDPMTKATRGQLVVTLVRGAAVVSYGGQSKEVAAGFRVTAREGKGLGPATPAMAPDWIENEPLTTFEQKAADKLASELAKGPLRPLTLREFLQDPSRDVRRLAIDALALTGDYPVVMDALKDEKHIDSRQAAVRSLRAAARRNVADRAEVEQAARQAFAGKDGDAVFQLIVGFTDVELQQFAPYDWMIEAIDSDNSTICELALYNLGELAGNDQNYQAAPTKQKRGALVDRWTKWRQGLSPDELPPRRGREN